MFPGPWMHGHGGRKSRFFERGALKYVILDLVGEQPRHGYDIIRELEERSGGHYSPSAGAIYPTLQLLEDQGLVRVAEENGKKVYELTDEGKEYLKEHKERIKQHREKMAEVCPPRERGEQTELRYEVRRVYHDLGHLTRHSLGDAEKIKAVQVVLEEARDKVAEIVKEEPKEESKEGS